MLTAEVKWSLLSLWEKKEQPATAEHVFIRLGGCCQSKPLCIATCLPGHLRHLTVFSKLEWLVHVACLGHSVFSGLACGSPAGVMDLQLQRLPTPHHEENQTLLGASPALPPASWACPNSSPRQTDWCSRHQDSFPLSPEGALITHAAQPATTDWGSHEKYYLFFSLLRGWRLTLIPGLNFWYPSIKSLDRTQWDLVIWLNILLSVKRQE